MELSVGFLISRQFAVTVETGGPLIVVTLVSQIHVTKQNMQKYLLPLAPIKNITKGLKLTYEADHDTFKCI